MKIYQSGWPDRLCVSELGSPGQGRRRTRLECRSPSRTIGAAVPPRPGRAPYSIVAIVHVAMHDAIQAFEGRFEPYVGSIPNASGSPIAAAATAAHDVLVARFPSQTGALDTSLQLSQ